jgi:hypothetical protein
MMISLANLNQISITKNYRKKTKKKQKKHAPIKFANLAEFVNLAKYQYILTNNKTKCGDFHALMPALFGKAAHDPDAAQDQEHIQGASWVQPRAPAR